MLQDQDLTVVVPHFGSYDLLRRCLSCLDDSGVRNVVVVEDGCFNEGIRQEFGATRFVHLSQNSGFAAACNRGLSEVITPVVAFVNNDIWVTPDWHLPILETLSKNPSVAACQPKILSARNLGEFDYAGAAGGYVDRYGYPFCRGRIFDSIERDLGQYDTMCEIFWASGAALVARTHDVRALGGFDPSFFAFQEELDLCWRLRAQSGRIVFVPQSVVLHEGSATWKTMPFRRAYLLHRNSILTLVKNCREDEFGQVLCVRGLMEFASAAFFITKGDPIRGAAILGALGRNAINMFGVLRKYRNRTAQRAPVIEYLRPYIYPGSIVVDHFLRGIQRFSELEWSPSLSARRRDGS